MKRAKRPGRIRHRTLREHWTAENITIPRWLIVHTNGYMIWARDTLTICAPMIYTSGSGCGGMEPPK